MLALDVSVVAVPEQTAVPGTAVIVDTAGVAGCGLITADVAALIQPELFFT